MHVITHRAFVPIQQAPLLAANTVHLWLMQRDAIMSRPHELAAHGHVMLNRLLMTYCDCSEAPVIARDKHGKPYLPDCPELSFNLSHSGRVVLLAFARKQPLGVDVELISRQCAVEKLAKRFFHADETAALERLPDEQRQIAFMRLWTCKEAVLKATGHGLAFGLDRVRLNLDLNGRPSGSIDIPGNAYDDKEQWQLLALEPAADYVGALAWRGSPREVLTFESTVDEGTS